MRHSSYTPRKERLQRSPTYSDAVRSHLMGINAGELSKPVQRWS
jgi:hypothetical protein